MIQKWNICSILNSWICGEHSQQNGEYYANKCIYPFIFAVHIFMLKIHTHMNASIKMYTVLRAHCVICKYIQHKSLGMCTYINDKPCISSCVVLHQWITLRQNTSGNGSDYLCIKLDILVFIFIKALLYQCNAKTCLNQSVYLQTFLDHCRRIFCSCLVRFCSCFKVLLHVLQTLVY